MEGMCLPLCKLLPPVSLHLLLGTGYPPLPLQQTLLINAHHPLTISVCSMLPPILPHSCSTPLLPHLLGPPVPLLLQATPPLDLPQPRPKHDHLLLLEHDDEVVDGTESCQNGLGGVVQQTLARDLVQEVLVSRDDSVQVLSCCHLVYQLLPAALQHLCSRRHWIRT